MTVDSTLAAVAGGRLCVLGDLMLDVHEWGRVERISAEAPVPIVVHERTSRRPSGAGMAAQAAAGLGRQAVVVTAVGDDDDGLLAVSLLEEVGVRVHAVVDRTRPTPRKTRIRTAEQQLLRIDRERTDDLDPSVAKRLTAVAESLLRDCDAVLISDYAKGVCTDSTARTVLRAARAAGVPVVVDTKRPTLDRYFGATAVTPNVAEWRSIVTALGCPADSCAAEQVRKLGDFSWVVITRSADGLSIVGEGQTVDVPAYSADTVDVAGAGDACAAALALCLGAGVAMHPSAVLCSLVAGVAVGRIAHKKVTADEVRKAAAHFGL